MVNTCMVSDPLDFIFVLFLLNEYKLRGKAGRKEKEKEKV
jgi:hypothetical protein